MSTYDADSVHSRSDAELEEEEDDLDVLPQAPRVIPCTEIPPPTTFKDSGYVNVLSTYIIDSPDVPEEPLPPSPDLLLPPDPTTIELATLASQTPTGRTSSKRNSTSRRQKTSSNSPRSTSNSQNTTSSSQDASVCSTTMNTNPHAQFAALQENDVSTGDSVAKEAEEELVAMAPDNVR